MWGCEDYYFGYYVFEQNDVLDQAMQKNPGEESGKDALCRRSRSESNQQETQQIDSEHSKPSNGQTLDFS